MPRNWLGISVHRNGHCCAATVTATSPLSRWRQHCAARRGATQRQCPTLWMRQEQRQTEFQSHIQQNKPHSHSHTDTHTSQATTTQCITKPLNYADYLVSRAQAALSPHGKVQTLQDEEFTTKQRSRLPPQVGGSRR